MLRREAYDEARGRYDYFLTDKGRALWPVMTALRQWGDEWVVGAGNEPVLVEPRRAATWRPGCSPATTAASDSMLAVRAIPGPGAVRTHDD
ncbi:MAG: winged helix-turn-helix transcriptional regulator [Ilumatobacteraceae bacterium]